MFRQEIRNRNFLGKNNRENILFKQYHYILKLIYENYQAFQFVWFQIYAFETFFKQLFKI